MVSIFVTLLYNNFRNNTPANVRYEQEMYESRGHLLVHFTGSGFNNQVHQVLNGIAIAKLLNYTYCMVPFVRRKSDEINSQPKLTYFSELFDINYLSSIVSLEPISDCRSYCDGNIDFVLNMSPDKLSKQAYNRQNIMANMGFNTNIDKLIQKNHVFDMDSKWLHWMDEVNVRESLPSRNVKCLELFQPFPASNIITRGRMNFIPTYLKFSRAITTKAGKIVSELFDKKPYISVHWRQEYQPKGESKCRKKILPVKGAGDVCFVIFLKKRRASLKDYLNFGSCEECRKYLQFVRLKDIGNALRSFQVTTGIHEIFLASDADEVVLNKLRRYVDFKIFSDSETGRSMLASDDMESISVTEQSLCVQSAHFMGTSYSTWTTTVWLQRSRQLPSSKAIYGFLDFLSQS